MPKLGISTGTTPNDGTGDTLLSGAIKINSNFNEIYNYFGDGTNLTGAGVTSITAGSGISIDQSTGNVTITATGGGGGGESYWSSTTAGIHTLSSVGIGTTNPTSALTVKGNTSLETLNVSGVSTFAGITTVTGTTLFTKQLNVSGISTFNEKVKILSNLEVGEQLDALSIGLKIWNGNAADSYLELFGGSNEAYIRNTGTTASGININATGSVALGGGGSGGWSILANSDGSASLALNVIEKLRTIGAGVTVTGTTFTNQLNVSGVSTVGIVTGATYYGDASNTVDGRWTLGANGTSDYTFTGIGFTQTTNDPVLYLARGRVYEFVNNSGGSHPFQIRVGNGGAAYNDGVTNNGSASGTIRFEVPFNAPNTLYYQCTAHSGMGNTISVYPSTI